LNISAAQYGSNNSNTLAESFFADITVIVNMLSMLASNLVVTGHSTRKKTQWNYIEYKYKNKYLAIKDSSYKS